MTPKEKAELLIAKYQFNVYKKAFQNTDLIIDRYYCIDNDMAKQCALIAVDEILKLESNNGYYFDGTNITSISYWQEVKQEIEKI